MSEMYRDVPVAGVLYTQFGDYLLLSSHPIEKDSWQSDNQTRFVVTPQEAMIDETQTVTYYAPARHIVITPPWCIEYTVNPRTVKVKVAELDLSMIEILEPDEFDTKDDFIQAKFDLEV